MATSSTVEVAHGGHGDGEFPPFNTATYPGQLLWLALTFGFLYWMVAKRIAPRLSTIIETRRSTIAADLEAASAQRSQADEAGRAYEQSLGTARANAQAIALETRTRLASDTEARRKAVEAELSAKLAAAETTIKSRTADAMANVRTIAADAAGAIVERLTGRAPDGTAVASALDRAKA